MTAKWIEKPHRQRSLKQLNESPKFFVKCAGIFRRVAIMEYIPAMVAVVFSCEACEETWYIPAKATAIVSSIKSDGINVKLAASKNASMLR